MLAQRAQDLYTPPNRPLAMLRRDVVRKMAFLPCEATKQRILLAVHEVIANILRHAHPIADDIQVEFITHDEQLYCVIRDNGGTFFHFRSCWKEALQDDRRCFFMDDHMGLKMVSRLWPNAFYIPRSEAFPFNSFILPLTATKERCLPPYFHASHEGGLQ